MHGVAAKRRGLHFGWVYGYESWRLARGPELPGFLKPLRERAAQLLGCQPEELAEMLVTEYPSAHRDAPTFGPALVGHLIRGGVPILFSEEGRWWN